MGLLRAETEHEVDSILEKNGCMSDDPSIWRPFGDNENNQGTINNQQDDPTPALIEKIINSVDAVLLAKCFEKQIDPRSVGAPSSMSEAAERFFGVRKGRLDSIDSQERTELADNIHFIATGSKTQPNYLIVDRREGQTPHQMPNTFLSLNKKNKWGIPFTQGINNSGGTGVLPFCGEQRYQLILSRRNPACPVDEDDPTGDFWGFTIVRKLRPEKGKRPRSMYVYLAPGGQISNFRADEVSVLPGSVEGSKRPAPYTNGLEYGSCVKLYSYKWTTKTLVTRQPREELEKYLYTLCLPVRISETRDYEANSYQTTLSGLSVNIKDHYSKPEKESPLEKYFDPAPANITVPEVGKLPITIVVYKARNEDGSRVNMRHVPHGAVFTVNGQVHASLPNNFISSRAKLNTIAPYTLVVVNCNELEPEAAEDLFPSSRDRYRHGEIYESVEQRLAELLRTHPGLKELNARRRQEELKDVLTDEEPLKVLQKLVNADPALAALMPSEANGRVPDPHVPEKNGKPFEGRRFPSYFQIRKEPSTGLVKACPINSYCHVDFETDAENNYFERAESPGTLKFLPQGICSSNMLFNGKMSARFVPPPNAQVGDEIPITVTVTDDNRPYPFISSFTIRIVTASDKETKKPGNSQPRGGRRATIPTPIMVTRDGREIDGKTTKSWEVKDFNEFSGAAVEEGDDGLDVYINMDNIHLLNQLKRETRSANHPLVMYWFKYGLLLSALGMVQEQKRRRSRQKSKDPDYDKTSENGADGDGLGAIEIASSGLSSVIVPIIHRLARGPDE